MPASRECSWFEAATGFCLQKPLIPARRVRWANSHTEKIGCQGAWSPCNGNLPSEDHAKRPLTPFVRMDSLHAPAPYFRHLLLEHGPIDVGFSTCRPDPGLRNLLHHSLVVRRSFAQRLR